MKISILPLWFTLFATLATASCKKELSPTPILSSLTADSVVTSSSSMSVGLAYPFKATPGTDVTLALQKALNTYTAVSIDNSYVISNSIQIPTKGSLIGLGNAVLKAASVRSGLLKSRGIYINLTDKSYVTLSKVKFKPAENMTDMSAYANAVILLQNSKFCTVDNNTFDFSFSYSKGMDAVWITGSQSTNNLVSNNFVQSLGITYCENGASYNIVRNNQLIKSHANALGGIGNGTLAATGNQVLNNYIENAGRMGIEDQQNAIGTIIKGNKINGTGKMAGIKGGMGMGISAVAKKTKVQNNSITDATDYYIEVAGRRSITVLDNTLSDNGANKGIFVNFLASPDSDLAQMTTIQGNIITGCLKAIETFGNATKQYVYIYANKIIDPVTHGVNLDLGNSTNAAITVVANTIAFNKKSDFTRYAIATFTRNPSGLQNNVVIIDKNTVSYVGAAAKGLGYDNALVVTLDNVQVKFNTINGYSGGRNTGVTSNGAKTKGVKFTGNIIKSAIWNIKNFL
jgi:hypothetical protein